MNFALIEMLTHLKISEEIVQTCFFTWGFSFRDALNLLEKASKHPFINEAWIDILVDNWEDILASVGVDNSTPRRLPDILEVLSNTVVSMEYFNKLRKLRKLKISSRSKVISSLLDKSIKTAEGNIKRRNTF